MIDLKALCADLAEEHQELDVLVSGIDEATWDGATPAPGWSIRDQISHLAFFDEQAHLAVANPDAFTASLGGITDVDAFINDPLVRARKLPPGDVLEWWRRARLSMLDVFGTADPGRRVPWFGPPMSLASFISARLMETWAHGQDVVDALGREREPSTRLRHVAHLGVRARPNSYAANGKTAPEGQVRVELEWPGGEAWRWNDSTTDSVVGPALDFCLVVTQRRHIDDTDLIVEGDLAREWMSIAQVFAGPPGPGRTPGQFRKARR